MYKGVCLNLPFIVVNNNKISWFSFLERKPFLLHFSLNNLQEFYLKN